jgi:hypothetical protein
MPRIVKLEPERLVHRIGITARRPEPLQAARLPDACDLVEFPMGEERIFRDALFRLLLKHHLHRIVEQWVGEVIGRLAHENAGAGLFPHQERQRAGVVVVRVADQDGIDRIELELLQLRQALYPLAARMHPRIQNDPPVALEIEQVRIGADLIRAS